MGFRDNFIIVALVGILGVLGNYICEAQELSFDNTCAICHFIEAESYNNSVHQKANVSCVDCHGGDPKILDKDASMDPKKGYIGEPKAAEVATFCGRCHEEVKESFVQSPHKSAADRGLMKACIECHNSHAVVPAELSIYQTSCVRCHGPGSEEVAYGQKILAVIGEISTNAVKASDLLAEAQEKKFKTNPKKVEAFKRDVVEKIGVIQHSTSNVVMNNALKSSQNAVETVQLDINRAINSVKWRKYGLIIAWVIILINVGVLYIKKRQMDGR